MKLDPLKILGDIYCELSWAANPGDIDDIAAHFISDVISRLHGYRGPDGSNTERLYRLLG